MVRAARLSTTSIGLTLTVSLDVGFNVEIDAVVSLDISVTLSEQVPGILPHSVPVGQLRVCQSSVVETELFRTGLLHPPE